MKVIKIILFGCCIFYSLLIYSQENKNYYSDEFPEITNISSLENNFLKQSKLKLLDKERFDFSFSVGTSFMSFGQIGLFSTNIMPKVRYKINDKFSLSAGVFAGSCYLPFSSKGSENSAPMSSKFYNYGAFVQVNYAATDRISINGTVFYSPTNQIKQSSFFTNIDIDYKLTEKIHLGVGLSIYKGNSLYNPHFSPLFSGFEQHFSPFRP